MFDARCIALLLEKKQVELEVLGININNYYIVNKLFNKYSFVIKNGKHFVFRDNICMSTGELLKEITKVLSISEKEANLITIEWIRDKTICNGMMSFSNKYYKWLSVPLPYYGNLK